MFIFTYNFKIEAHLDSLINEQAYFILSKTDLLDAYKIIQGHDSKQRGALVNLLGMDSGTLKAAMVLILIALFISEINYITFIFKTKFDVYLSSPDSLIIPQFNLLIGSNIRYFKRSYILTFYSYLIIDFFII